MGSIWYYYLYQSVLRHICLFLLFFQTFWVLYAYSIIWISFIFLFHFYFSFWFSIIPEFVASVIAIYLSWSPLACSSFFAQFCFLIVLYVSSLVLSFSVGVLSLAVLVFPLSFDVCWAVPPAVRDVPVSYHPIYYYLNFISFCVGRKIVKISWQVNFRLHLTKARTGFTFILFYIRDKNARS